MRRLAVVAFVAGCDFTFNLDHLKQPPIDGQPDTPDGEIIYMDAPGCFGKNGPGVAGLAQVCLTEAPPPSWTPNGEVHTGGTTNDCSMLQMQSGTSTELCIIAARNITLGGFLPTSGTRPLVLLATDTFTLLDTGGISVDSRRVAGRNGPGANESSCPGAPAGTASTTGSSGGAGGSFGGRGGNGGKGTGSAQGATATAAITGLAVVRGGCRGGLGGGPVPSGASGGAIYIIAGKRVEIAGAIDASGEGGGGGDIALAMGLGGDGGGGGGSGGLIGIDAPMIHIASSAKLIANGGGGGGGGDGAVGGSASGGAGGEADLSAPPTFPARGGTGGTASGTGGRGASGTAGPDPGQPAGTNVSGSGGGGGGGGAGIIRFYGPTSSVVNESLSVSPPPS
ncbi:MAG TPA: hypothetical protein VMZ53_32485 [Kofleriaceae bacterium]|nr:hypothetical protein [Kofleriaceae bacterium]